MDFNTAVSLKTLAKTMEIKDSSLRTFLGKYPRLVPAVQERKKLAGRLLFTPEEAEIVEKAYSRFIAGRCVECGFHPETGPLPPKTPVDPNPATDTPEPADGADGNVGGA